VVAAQQVTQTVVYRCSNFEMGRNGTVELGADLFLITEFADMISFY
jgi:hypothetical protein